MSSLTYTIGMMELSGTALVYERRVPLKIIAEEESKLRRLDLDDALSLEARAAAEQTLLQWKRVLELSLVFASLHDAVLQLGLRTVADLICASDRVDALVVTLSRLQPKDVVHENAELLRPYARLQPHADEPATIDTEAAVRSVQSLLLHCPIEQLERAGREHALADLAHRSRLAFDGLRAFVARRSHPQQEAFTAAGRVYAEGRASIDEVAAMLGLEVPDVVALLEDHGFRRSVDALRLSDEGRRERLESIRRDRLERAGQPASSPSQVARDVIASQRIEGVDARPWLRT
jgi:hypothetical protein